VAELTDINAKIIEAWKSGAIVVHPTESLPGMSANPELKNFFELLSSAKGEARGQKPPLSLVSRLKTAKKYWQDLPPKWNSFLQSAWPGHLSVLHTASAACPKTLVSDGLVGLRVSAGLPQQMQAILELLQSPWPSTSVNKAGMPPITGYKKAQLFVESIKGFESAVIPAEGDKPQTNRGASTIIKITGPDTGRILREGHWLGQNRELLKQYDLKWES
jgi:tRNA A37 threonylcarbamoyladenosine synthetase subunit TsaC/SUA5/YrdC